jgi:hypothetical protein
MNNGCKPGLPDISRIPVAWQPCVSRFNTGSDESTTTAREKVRARNSLVLLLLATIVSLAVLAKKNQYLPRSDPGRHVSRVTKMDQGHRVVLVDRNLLHDSAYIRQQVPTPTSGAFFASIVPWFHPAAVLFADQLRSPPPVNSV